MSCDKHFTLDPAEIEVDCPHCKRKAGGYCVDRFGTIEPSPHLLRVNRAKEQRAAQLKRGER